MLGLDGAGKTTVLERAKGLFGSRLDARDAAGQDPADGRHEPGQAGREWVSRDVLGPRGRGARPLALAALLRGRARRVYVVDAADADRLREARDAFDQACDHPDLVQMRPVCVLANKQRRQRVRRALPTSHWRARHSSRSPQERRAAGRRPAAGVGARRARVRPRRGRVA